MKKRFNKKRTAWVLIAFFIVFVFTPANYAAAEPIDDLVAQMQEIYGFMDDYHKGNIRNARTALQNFVADDNEGKWDTVLGVGTENNLLTTEVITRFGDEATARAAAKDILSGLGEIYYSTDPAGLRATLENYKEEYIDEFQLLFGDDITMDQFYSLFFDAREALPNVIDQYEAGLLANDSKQKLLQDMPEYLNRAMDAALESNPTFRGRLSAIGWSTEKLIAQQEVLAENIDPNGDARMSLALAVIRSETELAAGPTTLQAGESYVANDTYTIRIMGRNATTVVAWASADQNIVEVSNDSQTGNFVIEAVAPGSTELIVYRDYTEADPDHDWLLKFDVTVEGDETVKGYATWYKESDNAGITVTAKEGETVIAETETDADGLFLLALPDGTYTLELTVEGYLKTIIQNVAVVDGELVEVSTEGNPIKMSAGDIDESGLINLSDLGLLAASYGAESGQANYLLAADFDRSGLVNLSDLGYLAYHYGEEVTTIIYE